MAARDGARIVITGLGVVSPIGIGIDAFWTSLKESRSGIDVLSIPHDKLPSAFGAEVRDFDPVRHLRDRKFLKVMSRDMQLGVASARQAMADSGLATGDIDPLRLGVTFGAGRMTTHPEELAAAVKACRKGTKEIDMTRWGEAGLGRIAPLWLLRQLPNMPACHISIDHDAQGPNNTITSRDASALLALAESVRIIEADRADAVIVGACSSNIHPVDIAKFHRFEGLSQRSDHPSRACRPFDFERDGAVVGEGAATCIVERYEHAIRRGADIYAEVIGVGAGCDGRGINNESSGRGLVKAIESGMRRAGIRPDEIGHINAQGKSTQTDDIVESRAYHLALGDRVSQIPVTALKSYTGHFDAGAGAVELAGTLLAVRYGEVPATLNYEVPDPRCRINVVKDGPRTVRNRTAVSVNRTARGQSASAVLRAI
ncbi:MAG: beta-ketoacyl-[acyl-carrier-protein] synthase family protein [Fuerstiella sp.]|nr:beta-ketoacyl-[acyl-carrier-protein] synthase family protein [Fuerstiella sp.]